MDHRSRFSSAAAIVAALALCVGAAWSAPKPKAKSKSVPAPVTLRTSVVSEGSICVLNSKPGPQSVSYDKEYKQGDSICVEGAKAMVIQLDANMPECAIYSPAGQARYGVPVGGERGVYLPKAFEGAGHVITVRPTVAADLSTYRNLAFNPYDVRGAAAFYPHATSNSECRNEAAFCARNAIDGCRSNTGHGGWPVQSWGPDQRTDLWWKLEFGRPVEVDKLVLYIRADFPHDKYWHKAIIEFSDGTHEPISMSKTADAQEFKFKKRTVNWLRITDLVQEEPMGWCGFTEVEVWGKDAVSARS